MNIKGKGKYDGKKKVELEQELGLPPDTEIFFTVEEFNPLEKPSVKKQKSDKDLEEHPLLKIAKLAEPIGRSDLSVKHHEILGELVE